MDYRGFRLPRTQLPGKYLFTVTRPLVFVHVTGGPRYADKHHGYAYIYYFCVHAIPDPYTMQTPMLASSIACQTPQCSNLNREKERLPNIASTSTTTAPNNPRLRRVARSPAKFCPRGCHNHTRWVLLEQLTTRCRGFEESELQLEGHSYLRKTQSLTKKSPSLFAGHDPTRWSGQEGLKMSRVGSGRVGSP